MVDSVIAIVKTARLTIAIDTTFSLWYDEIILLAETESIGMVFRGTIATLLVKVQHYKRVVAIPLLDSLIGQMVERFSDEGHHASNLLCLVPSMLLSSGINPIEKLEGMLHWEKDLPFAKSLQNELIRWQALWEFKRRDGESQITKADISVPDNLLFSLGACDTDWFPNIHHLLLIACTLPITSAEA